MGSVWASLIRQSIDDDHLAGPRSSRSAAPNAYSDPQTRSAHDDPVGDSQEDWDATKQTLEQVRDPSRIISLGPDLDMVPGWPGESTRPRCEPLGHTGTLPSVPRDARGYARRGRHWIGARTKIGKTLVVVVR